MKCYNWLWRLVLRANIVWTSIVIMILIVTTQIICLASVVVTVL